MAGLIDSLESVTATFTRDGEADAAMSLGDLVYVSAVDHVNLAAASPGAASEVAGMALEDAVAGQPIKYALFGVVTKSGWGLTAGSEYYLSAATAGAMAVAPSSDAAGNFAILVGRALTTEDFLLNIRQSVLL